MKDHRNSSPLPYPCPRSGASRDELEGECHLCSWSPASPTPESDRTTFVHVRSNKNWNEMNEVLRMFFPYMFATSFVASFCGLALMARGQGSDIVSGAAMFAIGGTGCLLLIKHALRGSQG